MVTLKSIAADWPSIYRLIVKGGLGRGGVSEMDCRYRKKINEKIRNKAAALARQADNEFIAQRALV